jgi:hypothetical protein
VVTGILLVVAVVGAGLLTSTGDAAAAGPALVVSPAVAASGDSVLIRLDGWPQGIVTVAVCGNAARRGSEDCDQVGAETVAVRNKGPTLLRLTISVPPVGCPCAIRANTSTSDIVRTAPVIVEGVPGGVDIPGTGTPPAVTALGVRAKVTAGNDGSLLASILPPLAGTTQRTLVLTLTNRTASPLAGLRLVGASGRNRSGATPVTMPVVGPIPAGRSKVLRIPVDLGAPVVGHYIVFGTVYGLESPVNFEARTSNDPWGLELATIALLLVLAETLRYRERRRRRRDSVALGTATAASGLAPASAHVVAWPPAAADGVVAPESPATAPPPTPFEASPVGAQPSVANGVAAAERIHQ